MSIQLQRVAVRMRFDPKFADNVYADPARALAAESLTDVQRQWLVASDRRAWSVDPLLQGRTLHGLLTEYPVSGGLAVRAFGLSWLTTFFASRIFHKGMREGSSLSLLFGTWLLDEAGGDQVLKAMSLLETGMAGTRRGFSGPRFPPGRLLLRQQLPDGAVEAFMGLSAHMLELGRPMEDLALDLAVPLACPELPVSPREDVWVAFRPGAGVELELLPPAIADMLKHADEGADDSVLLATARDHGCSESEAHEVLNELVSDGMITPSGTLAAGDSDSQ